MKFKAIILSLLFITVVFPAFADDVTSAAVPKNLHVYNLAGSTYVDLIAHGCSGSRYYLNPNHPKYDTIIAILLAAQMADKKVMLRFNQCVNGTNPQGDIVGVYLL